MKALVGFSVAAAMLLAFAPASASATIFRLLPDLEVSKVRNPAATVAPGGSLKASDSTANTGSHRKAGKSKTAFYLATGKRIDKRAIALGSRKVKALRAGKKNSGRVKVKVPASAKVGSYYLIACADDPDRVRESSERNNCRASKKKVKVLGGWPRSWSGSLIGDGRVTDPDPEWDMSWHYDAAFVVSGMGSGSRDGDGGAQYFDLQSGSLNYHEAGSYFDGVQTCTFSGDVRDVPLKTVKLYLNTFSDDSDFYLLDVDWPNALDPPIGTGTDSCIGTYEITTNDLSFDSLAIPWDGADEVQGSQTEAGEGTTVDWGWTLSAQR